MSKTRGVCAGVLLGAMLLASGCRTMATREAPSPQTPAMGGAGLDPNPDHNIPDAPNGVGASPLNTPFPEDSAPAPR